MAADASCREDLQAEADKLDSLLVSAGDHGQQLLNELATIRRAVLDAQGLEDTPLQNTVREVNHVCRNLKHRSGLVDRINARMREMESQAARYRQAEAALLATIRERDRAARLADLQGAALKLAASFLRDHCGDARKEDLAALMLEIGKALNPDALDEYAEARSAERAKALSELDGLMAAVRADGSVDLCTELDRRHGRLETILKGMA